MAARGTFTAAQLGRLNTVTPGSSAAAVRYVRFTMLSPQDHQAQYLDSSEVAVYGTPSARLSRAPRQRGAVGVHVEFTRGHRLRPPDGTAAATVRRHDHLSCPTVGRTCCCRRRRRHPHLHHVRGGRRPARRSRCGGRRSRSRAVPPGAGTGRPAGEPHLTHPPAGGHAHRDHAWHRRPRPVVDGRGVMVEASLAIPDPDAPPQALADEAAAQRQADRLAAEGYPARVEAVAQPRLGRHRGRHAGIPGPGGLLPDQGGGGRRPRQARGRRPPGQQRLHRLGRAGWGPRALAARGRHHRPPPVPRSARRVGTGRTCATARPRRRCPGAAGATVGRSTAASSCWTRPPGPRATRPGSGSTTAGCSRSRRPVARRWSCGRTPGGRRCRGCRGRARSSTGAGRRPWTGSTACRAWSATAAATPPTCRRRCRCTTPRAPTTASRRLHPAVRRADAGRPGREVVLDAHSVVRSSAPTRGTALTAGQTSIQGTGALAQELARLHVGDRVGVRTRLVDDHGRTVRPGPDTSVVNGGPQLVRDGRWDVTLRRDGMVQTDNPGFLYGWAVKRNPRTFAGVDAQGRTVLVTADGRSTADLGLSIPETADVARSLGLTNAINLDGGGSTAMAVGGGLSRTRPTRPVSAPSATRCSCSRRSADVGEAGAGLVMSRACPRPADPPRARGGPRRTRGPDGGAGRRLPKPARAGLVVEEGPQRGQQDRPRGLILPWQVAGAGQRDQPAARDGGGQLGRALQRHHPVAPRVQDERRAPDVGRGPPYVDRGECPAVEQRVARGGGPARQLIPRRPALGRGGRRGGGSRAQAPTSTRWLTRSGCRAA